MRIKPHPSWLVGRDAEDEPRPSREHAENHKHNSNSVALNKDTEIQAMQQIPL